MFWGDVRTTHRTAFGRHAVRVKVGMVQAVLWKLLAVWAVADWAVADWVVVDGVVADWAVADWAVAGWVVAGWVMVARQVVVRRREVRPAFGCEMVALRMMA